MFEITVENEFAAAHRLKEYNGNCEKLHGHNWRVLMSLKTDRLDDLGLAIDFREARSMLAEALSSFDHAYLNDLEVFKNTNPSCERIAQHIFRIVKNNIQNTPGKQHITVSAIQVWESPRSSVTYRETD